MSRVVWTAGLTGVCLAACGARTELPSGGSPDGGLLGVDGGPCVGRSVPIDSNAPNLYLVLDRSGSMAQDQKWPNVRSAIASLITQLGARARFGAALFPAIGGDVCTTGAEVMPLTQGDAQGATAQTFLAATSMAPSGGTPTAQTLQLLAAPLGALAGQGAVTYAILATDGGPNCNTSRSCSVDQCTSNLENVMGCPTGGLPNCCDTSGGGDGRACLDGYDTLASIKALRAAGVPTYVMGIPGSAPYTTLLDAMAVAAGTARATTPYYYRVDTSDTSALGAALSEIAAKALASCVLRLTGPAPDPGSFNVYLGGQLVPRDGPDGWTLSGSTLTLRGKSCDALAMPQMPPVQATAGCPTVTH
jgi:hypothetical protein